MEYSYKPRRTGLSRNESLPYTLLVHNPHRKNKPQSSSLPPQSPPPRPSTPEDINALPLGSSDEHSTDSGSDLGRARKRRKKGHEGALDRVEGNHARSPLDQDIESGELPNEPSNIRGSIFPATSHKCKTEGDDEDPFASLGRSSQSRKALLTYSGGALKNIHKAFQEPEEANGKATDFHMHDTDAMCTKGKA